MSGKFTLDKQRGRCYKFEMRHLRFALFQFGFFLVISAVAVSGAGSSALAGEPGAREIFRKSEERFLGITSLSYTVKRKVSLKRSSSEEQWFFRYRDSGSGTTRIDYLVPHERTIIVDSDALWEYIPSAKKAMHTQLKRLPVDARQQTVGAVLSRVSVDGLRLGSYEEMAGKAVKIESASLSGREMYRIEGAGPKYVVHIDKSRNVLVKMEIFDKDGRLVIRTEASRFIEVEKDFWMPQEIRASYTTPEGPVKSTVVLQDIRVNAPMQDEVFQLKLQKDVAVISN